MSNNITAFEKHLDGMRQTAYGLAVDADTYSPDAKDSPGANFLLWVQDAVLEEIEVVLGDEGDAHDRASEIADSAVPIYTHDLWKTFVDLGAYNEDTHGELGDDGSDLTKSAQYALYLIGSRLAHSIIEAARTAHEEWVEEHEADCKHCGRPIVLDEEGRWLDPEATGDDSMWSETCDANHEDRIAAHEPVEDEAGDDVPTA